MNPSHQQKKRPKRSHNQSAGDGRHYDQQRQQQNRQVDRQKKHQEALALSQELRHLSSQKRLKECLDLYHSPANDELRDAHHMSIVVDCCARCGDVEKAEQIVEEMLQSQTPQKKGHYFWEGHELFSDKRQIPIQAWTALLKAYIHSGMMARADALFRYLCTAAAGDGESKNRKRKKEGANNGPNVRTLNTLLRGCLWTATSIHNDGINATNSKKIENKGGSGDGLVGGVSTAERAWSLCGGKIIRDSSSYEYFISILSQSLQCKRAEGCLQKMRGEFGIPDHINLEKGKDILDGVDPTLLESVVVSLVAIARGYALLGEMSDGLRCAEEALNYLDLFAANKDSGSSSPNDPSSAKKQTTGGKRAWKESKTHAHSGDDGNSSGRREESNKLFRNHRLSELRSEAQNLSLQCSCTSAKQANQTVAQLMLTRLLYFSGGGTTGKVATRTDTAKANVEEDIIQTHAQWIHSLWLSFGLKETVQRMFDGKDKEAAALQSILQKTSKKQSKKSKRFVPSLLSPEACDRLRGHIAGEDSVLSSDGRVDFKQVFKPLNDDIQQGRKLHIELGAGSGDWAALQAELNPSGQYVTVELRADRVAQTFAKCMLRQHEASGKSKPLTNLCCVGSECGLFLNRVEAGSVNTVFVNHPEPPTQTYAFATDNGDSKGKTDNATEINTEEPAHMLNTQTILSAARCLEPHGKGRLVIVTDNLIYARLICHTVVRLLEEDAKLVGVSPSEVRDLRRIESFENPSIHLYEGKPSLSIGHYVSQSKKEGGTSYFDRLWRTGAGKHADMRKRFIICLRTSGGSNECGSSGVKSHGGTLAGGNESKKTSGEEKKLNKKRITEKQRRRNERRLLKKQQAAQGEKE
ncbi:hypothetical protein ACHAXR_012344 [Thalassiosira sp. AJA248-18]